MKLLWRRSLAVLAAAALIVTMGGLPALAAEADAPEPEGETFTHLESCPERDVATSKHASREDCRDAVDLQEAQELLTAIRALPDPAKVPPFSADQRRAVQSAQAARLALLPQPASRTLGTEAQALLAGDEGRGLLDQLDKLTELEAFRHLAGCPQQNEESSAHRSGEDCQNAMDAARVEAALSALPEGVAALDEARLNAVREARGAYDGLDAQARALVNADLVSRLAALEQLPFAHLEDCPDAGKTAAESHGSTEDCQKAIGAREAAAFDAGVVALADLAEKQALTGSEQARVAAVRAAYAALSDHAKALVDGGRLSALEALEKLPFAHLADCPDPARAAHSTEEGCRAAIAASEAQAPNRQAAEGVLAQLRALPAPDGLTALSGEQLAQVKAARAAYGGLSTEALAQFQALEGSAGAVARLEALEKLSFAHAPGCPEGEKADSAHTQTADCQSAIKKAAEEFSALLAAFQPPAEGVAPDAGQLAAAKTVKERYEALSAASRELLSGEETQKVAGVLALLNASNEAPLGEGPVGLEHNGAATRHATIAAALEKAQNGDVITLGGGNYAESLTLDKKLTVRAADPANAVRVDGHWTVKADLLIDGVSFSGAGSAAPVLHLDAGASLTVKNAGIDQSGAGPGIRVGGAGSAYGARLTLENVLLHADAAGGSGVEILDAGSESSIGSNSTVTADSGDGAAVRLELGDADSRATLHIQKSALTAGACGIELGRGAAAVTLTDSTVTAGTAVLMGAGGNSSVIAAYTTLNGVNRGAGSGTVAIRSAGSRLTLRSGSVLKSDAAGSSAGQWLLDFSGLTGAPGTLVTLEDATLIHDGRTPEMIRYGGVRPGVSTAIGTAFRLSGGNAPVLETDRDGGFVNAYADLTAAVAAVSADHTLSLSAGTYAFDALTIAEAGVTLRGAGETSVLTPSGAGLTAGAEGVAVESLKITGKAGYHPLRFTRGGRVKNVTLTGGDGLLAENADDLTVDGLRVLDSAKAGVSVRSSNVELKNSALTGADGSLALLAPGGGARASVTLGAGNRYTVQKFYSEWGAGATADRNRVVGLPQGWSAADSTEGGVRRTLYAPTTSSADARVERIRIQDEGGSFEAIPDGAFAYRAVVRNQIRRGDITVTTASSRASAQVGQVDWIGREAAVPITVTADNGAAASYTLRLVRYDVQVDMTVTDEDGRDRTDTGYLNGAPSADGVTVAGLAAALDLTEEALDAGTTSLRVRVEVEKTEVPDRDRMPTSVGTASQRREVDGFLSDEDHRIAGVLDISIAKVRNGVSSQVARLDRPVTVTYRLPAAAQDRRGYRVLHLTGSGVEEIAPDWNGSRVSFETDRFSSFVITYSAKSKSSGGSGGGGGGSSGPSDAERNEDFWQEVREKIRDAQDGDIVKANASGMLNVPAGVLRELSGRDVTLVVSHRGDTTVIHGLNMLDVPKNRVFYSFSELHDLYENLDPAAPSDGLPDEIYHPGYVEGVTQPTVVVNPPAKPATSQSSSVPASSEPEESEPESSSSREEEAMAPSQPEEEPEPPAKKAALPIPALAAVGVAALALLTGVGAFAFYRFKNRAD